MKSHNKLRKILVPTLVFLAVMGTGLWLINPVDSTASLEPVKSIEAIDLAKPSEQASVDAQPGGDLIPAQQNYSSPIPEPEAPEVSFEEVTDIEPLIETFEIEPTKNTQIRYKRSGTIIRIPEMALVDENGNPVTGPVTITYREFRDAPDFILSDIPMTYEDESGEPFRFSSTGMFEMRASQKGKEVFIKEGASIEMEFAMTSVEPNTNFYAYSDVTNKWTEIGVVNKDGVEIDEAKAEKVVRKKPFKKNWEFQEKEGTFLSGVPSMYHLRVHSLKTGTDTSSTVIRVIEDGQKYAKRSGKNIYRYSYPFDTKGYRSRVRSTHYWQTTKKSDIAKADHSKYEVVSVELDTLSSKDALMRIELQNGYYKELEGLATFTWKIKSPESVLSKLDQPFYGLEVHYSKKYDKYNFRLKGENRFVNISAIPTEYRKVKRDTIQVKNLELKAHRQKTHTQRKAFNRSIALKKDKYDKQMDRELDEFWRYSSLFMGGRELSMDKEEWLEHFGKNNKKMQTRYEKLAKSDWVDPRMTQEMIQGRRDQLIAFKEKITKKFGKEIHKKWREWVWVGPADQNPRGNQNFQEWNEKGDGVNRSTRQATMLASGMDAGHTYPELVRNLNVGDFGVYNCDQIFRVKNNQRIMATYIDEKGDTLSTAAILSLIDYSFNGAFSFAPHSFAYNPDAKNAFILFCEGKKTYIADSEAFAAADVEDGQAIFRVKNVTGVVETTDQLREVLEL